MRNLLSAGFYRLLRYRLFWITLAGYVAVCVIAVFDQYRVSHNLNYEFTADYALFHMLPTIGFFLAVLNSIFLGDEFRGGTIRNKIIAGYSRNVIYCSNFIVMAAVSIVELLTGYLVSIVTGFALGGNRCSMDGSQIVILIVISAVTMVVYSALFTAIVLIIGNRTASVAVCLIITGLMLFSAIMIMSRLEEPEQISDYVLSQNGTVEKEEPYDNPLYVEGTKRQILTGIHKLLPTGQAIRILQGGGSPDMFLYSLVVIVLVTAVGMVIFYRRDIQ